MKVTKKNIYFSLLVIIVIISIGVPFVYGATKSNDSLQNHLAIPVLQGEIKETFTPDVPIKIGGTPQIKKVEVVNKGNTPFFVRIMIFPEIMTASNDLLPSNIGKEIIVDFDKDWLDGKDGYYYYNGNVSQDKKISDVFETVKLSEDLDERYAEANLSIQIKIETVTSSNYEYRKAWWNGEVNTKPDKDEWKVIDDKLEVLVQNNEKEG